MRGADSVPLSDRGKVTAGPMIIDISRRLVKMDRGFGPHQCVLAAPAVLREQWAARVPAQGARPR
jgi:hypothetical protein